MPIANNITKEIAAAVAGSSHNAKFMDKDGRNTLNLEDATYQYLSDQSVMILVKHEDVDVVIWFDNTKTDLEWLRKDFVPRLKHIARRYLYGTTVRSYDGKIEPKQMIAPHITESRNSTNISYHQTGSANIRLAHSKPVVEEKPGSRSRNIKALFIEKEGERFRYPYNHLMGAKVMGLHVDQGGKPWDNLGEKILEISRRRKDIMELLRWSKKIEETAELLEIRTRGKDEVVMLRRMMERSVRLQNLDQIKEYQLPERKQVTEDLLTFINTKQLTYEAYAGLAIIQPHSIASESMRKLVNKKSI